jgi:hypothetical protein
MKDGGMVVKLADKRRFSTFANEVIKRKRHFTLHDLWRVYASEKPIQEPDRFIRLYRNWINRLARQKIVECMSKDTASTKQYRRIKDI